MRILLAGVLSAALLTACSGDDPGPTSTTVVVPANAPKASDEAAIRTELDGFLAAYNAGDFATSIRYITERVEEDCGGPSALATALSKNDRATKSTIEIDAITIYEDSLTTDLHVIQSYSNAPASVLTLGYPLRLERGHWRFDDYFPPGAGAFCG